MGFLELTLVYVGTFVTVSVIDYVWHLVLMRKPFEKGIAKVGVVVDGEIKIQDGLAGLISQVLVVGAIMFLVLYGRTEPSLLDGVLVGGAGGILAISVYGLVNRALIKGWNKTITILEVVWGPVLGATAGAIIVALSRLF